MSLEGWIFMVGLRVIDLGALAVWLIWFYRQCDQEDDEPGGDDFRRSDDQDDQPPVPPSSGGGLGVPLPDAAPWPTRRREHGDRIPTARPARRQPAEPDRTPIRT